MAAPFQINRTWKPPGPVSAAFMKDREPIQALTGPIGAGKTTTIMWKFLKIAQEQQPSIIDGVRRIKACVVRDTYRQLWKTTIPSWHGIVPKDVGLWQGADNAPSKHTIVMDTPRGKVELVVDFVAIGENKVEDVLRGYEVTVFYLNEADLMAQDVLTYTVGRAGRFPKMAEGGPTWYGVLLDFNAPDEDSYIFDMFYTSELPAGVSFFRQPGGREPGAENLANLPPGYYELQASLNPDWYTRRMIDGLPGFSRAGKPVFPEFIDTRHVALNQSLVAHPKRQLIIGLDAGLTPAATLWQKMPSGQWRGYRELVTPNGQAVGAKRFAEYLRDDTLAEEQFRYIKDIVAYADPSAAEGVDREAGELDWIESVGHHARLRIYPAPTNQLSPRIDAVRECLTRPIEGGQYGLLIDKSMVTLRRGFMSGYVLRRKQIANRDEYEDQPVKNRWSHVQDTAQYALLGGGEYTNFMGRQEQRQHAAAARRVTSYDNSQSILG